MRELWNMLQAVFTGIGGWLGYFLGSVLRTAVIFFYLSNEGISLLENASHLGLPIPTVVKKALNQLHDKSENKENENEQQ